MNFADSLIKKYDLTDLKNLDDDEIFILWIEITTGFDTLILEENSKFNALKPMNFMSWNNLVTEVKDRNLLENEKIPKILSSSQYATRIENRPLKVQTRDFQLSKRFRCDFCVKGMTELTGLIQHINSIHFGHRFKCLNCNIRQDIRNRRKEHMIKIEKVEMNSKLFEIINCLIKCDFCAQLFTAKTNCRQHIRKRHNNDHIGDYSDTI